MFIYTTLINLRSLEELGRAWKSLESFALSLRVRSVFTKLRQAPSLWFWVQPSTGHFWFRLWHPETDSKQLANWNGDSLWKSEKCNCFNSEKHLHWVLLLKHCRCLILSIATKRNSLSTSHTLLTFIDIYWHLLTFIDIYWHLLTFIDIYWHISNISTIVSLVDLLSCNIGCNTLIVSPLDRGSFPAGNQKPWLCGLPGAEETKRVQSVSICCPRGG